MTSLDSAGRAALAARLLAVSVEVARSNTRELTAQNASYFWGPGRGGGALIVGADGSVLFANSSVLLDDHVAAFASGRRTDPAAFNDG